MPWWRMFWRALEGHWGNKSAVDGDWGVPAKSFAVRLALLIAVAVAMVCLFLLVMDAVDVFDRLTYTDR